jgi:hypothetical protein
MKLKKTSLRSIPSLRPIWEFLQTIQKRIDLKEVKEALNETSEIAPWLHLLGINFYSGTSFQLVAL